MEEHEMDPLLRMSAAVLLSGLFATPASAQTQPRDPNMPDPKNVPAEKIAPDIGSTGSTGSGGTLSDRLERSEGVIKPPPIGDTEAVISPPQVPDMPVIKPPGTSPSDPVQPK
jgi:hypothetical protein